MSYPAFLKGLFGCDEGALRALSSQPNTRFCVDKGYIDAPTILRKNPASRTVYSRGDPCGRPGCALSSLSGYMGILAWLTSAPLLATLGCRLAFTASLRTLIVCATTRLGQNTILLNFADVLLEG